MEIVNIPIIDFYKYCLDCAYERGFKWVLCFLAREADAEICYKQIQKYWDSLHDLTGNPILFVFAGALKEDKHSSILYNERYAWRGIKNVSLHFVDDHTFKIPNDKYPKKDFSKDIFNEIAVNHTRSISELRDYFGLSEKDVPSLVFTPTYRPIQDKHIVVHIKREDIYQEIKKIIGEIEEPLKELKVTQEECRHIRIQITEISKQIEILNHGTQSQRRYFNAKSELNKIINNTDNDNEKNNLIKSMRSQSVSDWHMFNRSTRAYLNQYLDLLKNNPSIDCESEKTVKELTKLHIEKANKESIVENLRYKIIWLYKHLDRMIVNFDENTFSIGEKRFKIAFSFPGEYRDIVYKIARGVADSFSEDCILYDYFHREEFARPNLDIHLQNLYKNESEIIVVFICAHYNKKKWCGIEWRAIRELLNSREADDRILFVKCGEGEVDGVFSTVDGYIDSAQVDADEIVKDIIKRYFSVVNSKKDKDMSIEKY